MDIVSSCNYAQAAQEFPKFLIEDNDTEVQREKVNL